MRGAAKEPSLHYINLKFLLTRLMRGAAFHFITLSYFSNISTHAPHARRGVSLVCFSFDIISFLLTRLMRGAAFARQSSPAFDSISTHAPHARRGRIGHRLITAWVHFYSRASCEARRVSSVAG